jgi:hypothetical protein
LAICPMCRAAHVRLATTRRAAARRRAPARLARALRPVPRRLVSRRPGRGEWAGGRLSAAQRRQHGRHPEYGRLTIPQMLDHWAEHDLNHLEQIRAAHRRLAGRRPRRP